MGGGDGMSELSLIAALSSARDTIPQSVLHALRSLDQETGEDTEREALDGVVNSLVEWFLQESKTPRSSDGACVVNPSVIALSAWFVLVRIWQLDVREPECQNCRL